jgi:V/A-type H+-transporting ATPase subunit E
MGLNKVADEIRLNAEREAERIVGEGRKEGERILEEAKKRLKEREEDAKKEIASSVEQITIRNQTLTQKRMKEFVMNTKREAVEKVYVEFLASLKTAGSGEKEKMFRKMQAGAKSQIAKPETVYVRREDAPLAKKLFRGIEVKSKDMEGGFMLESGDGKEIVDYRFETVVELLKGKTLKNVTKTLFGE